MLATLVSTISEYGSESAFENLQAEASKIRCRVQRANGLQDLPIEEIVVGDLVVLQPGDRIPADGVILRGRLEVDQSALNGESRETQKYPAFGGAVPGTEKGLMEPNRLFSGSIVCAGEGMMRVSSVGDHTFYGDIATEIQEAPQESPLRHRLNGLAAGIGKFGYIAAGISAGAFLFNNIFIDNSFSLPRILETLTSGKTMLTLLIQACTLGVTVVVMAVPEGLPMMITVVLSANMKRMLKDHVLVRKLVGIETAGSLNILFTDKTGTLTSGKLDVIDFVDGAGKVWSREQLIRSSNPLCGVLKDSLLYNSSATLNKRKAVGGNSTDRAAVKFAFDLPGGHEGLKNRTLSPFTSEKKWMSSSVSGAWNATLFKGAPEKILPLCTKYYEQSGSKRPLAARFLIESLLRQYTEKSMRIIAVAVGESNADPSGLPKNLSLVGLLAIRDNIRPQSRAGITQVQEAGIQTVMITGDAKPTASAIAREIGLLRSESDLVITHDELAAMQDSVLSDVLPRIRVVARALPSDKSRLVKIAQAEGLVVGMTGDGINDAPALKQADVGFAMGSGTEVAKEAGDIVILNNRFDCIAKAVCYGRTIFKSIRKFIIYQMSTCLCAVGVTVLGPLIKVDFPITVIQMLWINIVMDTLAGLAFGGEQARPAYMREPPKRRDEPIVNRYMKNQIAVSSVYTIILCLTFLKSPFFRQADSLYALTSFFTLFMFCAIFNSFNARTHRMNLLSDLLKNVMFIALMSAVVLIQLLIIFFGGQIFRTVPLSLKDLCHVILLAFTVIPVDLVRKYLIRKNRRLQGT